MKTKTLGGDVVTQGCNDGGLGSAVRIRCLREPNTSSTVSRYRVSLPKVRARLPHKCYPKPRRATSGGPSPAWCSRPEARTPEVHTGFPSFRDGEGRLVYQRCRQTAPVFKYGFRYCWDRKFG